MREDDENGVLVGLYDRKMKFKNIGVLKKIDHKDKKVKIFTNCDFRALKFGKVKIDEEFFDERIFNFPF